MRYRLRTLLIVLAVVPPIVAVGWWSWPLPLLIPFPVVFVGTTVARMWAGLVASADGNEGFLSAMFTIAIAAVSVIAGLFVADQVYLAFGDFGAMYGGTNTPRVVWDLFIALAAGSIPGALLFWLTWPRVGRHD